MKAYFKSQLNYGPLVWMNNSRPLNNRINNLQKRALRLVYKEFNFTFSHLLEKDKFVFIYQRNLLNL